MKYGYCRISKPKQNIERQVQNIKEVYPDAIIIKEIFTRTQLQGRKELLRLLKLVKAGDMIIFDSVSRMGGNADEGFETYKLLFDRDVELVFLKEPHVNTAVYRESIQRVVPLTGTNVDYILEGINKYLLTLAEKQIRIAFEQSEKEVLDIRQRTKDGIRVARAKGKQIGQRPGIKLETKKAKEAKEKIKKYNKTFGGPLTNEETWTLIGICRASFYKYKRELCKEMLLALPDEK